MTERTHIFRFLLCLFCAASTSSISAQYSKAEFMDSLFHMLESEIHDTVRFDVHNELFRNYYRVDVDEAKVHMLKELELAKMLNDADRLGKAKNHEGIYFNVISDFKGALKAFTELKEIYERNNNEKRVAVTLQNIANVYRNTGDLTTALKCQMESLEINERIGTDKRSLANCYFSVGNIHGEIENLELSTEYYKQAKVLYKDIDNEEFAMRVNHMIGLNYMIQDSLLKARAIFLNAEQFYRNNNSPNDLVMALDNLGNIDQKEGRTDEALKKYEEALELAENNGVRIREFSIYSRIGQLYYEQNNLDAAETNLIKSLGIARALGARDKVLKDYNYLSKVYRKKDDFEKAYQYQSSYVLLNDSLKEERNIAAMQELETKYQTEKKQKEIEFLEEKAKRNKLEKNAMTGGIIGLLCVFGALFYAMKQRMVKNKVEKEKVDQKLVFSKRELEFSQTELELKQRELTAYALQLAHKNEVLEEIKERVNSAKKEQDNNKVLQGVINKIDFNQNDNESWEGFRSRFQAVHKSFESNVKNSFPDISTNDLRLMSLLKMNLSNKEIANILNISGEGIKKARYRLRKKLQLERGASLEDLVISL